MCGSEHIPKKGRCASLTYHSRIECAFFEYEIILFSGCVVFVLGRICRSSREVGASDHRW